MTKEVSAFSILIADDNESDRLILKTILSKQGYSVLSAPDGASALELYEKESPDMVLLDALMPVMDGFEAAKIIKKLAGEDLVPIIFITSLKDATSLADCLEAGGDDFISKPYNRIILHAKIQAHARMKKLHATIQEQRDKIATHHEHLLREQEVAKAVFDNIAHNGCINSHNIKYLLSPMSIFNGDVVLVEKKPSEGMYVFLGDFTGHGLPAAIGTMPVSEIFYGMTKKGFTMEEILKEINSKLKQILPIGVFCCACMIDFSFHSEVMKVWVGGLPSLFIKRKDQEGYEIIKSSNLPLGVLSDDRFSTKVDILNIYYGDKVFLWSDGILEAENSDGEMFGEDRITEVFESSEDSENIFDSILEKISSFTGEVDQNDDYTMLEVTVIPQEEFEIKDQKEEKIQEENVQMDCTITCEFRAGALKNFNPLPFVTHFFREVPGLKAHSGKLYTIMSELFSNALEHGVLGLSSNLKNSKEGFAQYYLERAKKIEEISDAFVVITLTCTPLEKGGKLLIRMEDSGAGFNHKVEIGNGHKIEGYCGRGIPLIMTMCKGVHYYGNGNIVEVIFEWEDGI